MRRFIDIAEAIQIEDPDEEDKRDTERYAREEKITQLIIVAFKRIGLGIAEDDRWSKPSIYYDESDRVAIVDLEDSDVDLDLLFRLKKTGLSDKFEIGFKSREMLLTVAFRVSPMLDNTLISPAQKSP